MFASDLGELFRNVGNGSRTPSTGVHAPSNGEHSRDLANLSHSSMDSNPINHNASISIDPSKTSVSNTTNALEDLFSSEYDISIKPLHMHQTVPELDPNLKIQPQLRTAGGTCTPTTESTTVSTKQSTIPTVHNRGGLRCPVCDKAFSNSSAIAKHKLTHSEERKYICGICNKAFKRQDHLNGHKYTHESKKPHACQFCDKSYSDARSLRRHYENAHPEEYKRWTVLSQATNGDTSAIAVAAAAALLSSSGLDKESTDQAVKELHVDPSTSAVLSSVLNGPVRSVLTANLSRSIAGLGGCDALKARSESVSPASSSAVNDNHGCSLSTATSPTAHADQVERDEDEPHDARTLVTITAQDMAAAAKVALIMAHPLEAPKRVACAVCQKRFKNQSALNGHMRLHGGYGSAGVTVSSITYGQTTTSTQSKPSKFHPLDDSYATTSEFHDKRNLGDHTDNSEELRPQRCCQNLTVTNLQSSNRVENPSSPTAHKTESSNGLFDFMPTRSNRDGSMWRVEAPGGVGGSASVTGCQREGSSIRSSVNASLPNSNGNTIFQLFDQSTSSGLRHPENRSTDPESHITPLATEKLSKSTPYNCSSYHIPRSASATAVSSMTNCCLRPTPASSETSWPMETNAIEEWRKSNPSQTNAQQMLTTGSSSSNSFSKNTYEPSNAPTWWSGTQQLVWNSDSRRMENTSWSDSDPKTGLSVDLVAQTTSTKLPQFLDLDSKSQSNRPWIGGENRSLLDDMPSIRRRCNPSLNLDLSTLSIPDRSARVEPHMNIAAECHSSGVNCASGHQLQPGSHTHDDLFHPQVGFAPSQHLSSQPACGVPLTLGNQYSPVTPAPGSASLIVDQKIEQPMAFTFPPAEPFQSTSNSSNNNNNTSYTMDPHIPLKTTGYCSSPPARLVLIQETPALSNKVSDIPERSGLRHSSSSGKLGSCNNRWHSAQSDPTRPISAHMFTNSMMSVGAGYANSSVNHQQRRLPPHHFNQDAGHIQQFSSGCNLNNLGPSTYLNESWSESSAHTESHSMESISGSTAAPSQRPEGIFHFIPSRDSSVHANDRVYYSRQRYPSDQNTGAKLAEQRTEFVQPYPQCSGSLPSQRHALNSDEKNPIRARPCQSATEAPASFGGNSHSFSNSTNQALPRPAQTSAEPERTRHTSAPFLHPADHSDPSRSQFSNPMATASRVYTDTSNNAYYLSEHRSHSPHLTTVFEREPDCDQTASRTSHHAEFTSDTVADLLMQSHITDSCTMPEKLARCSANSTEDTNTFTNPSSLTVAQLSSQSVPSTINSSQSVANVGYGDCHSPSVVPSDSLAEITIPSALPPTTISQPVGATNTINAASNSADESDQSAVTRLSKSLVEDSLFRNPHTLPLPKRLKRKPAPIFIPPQTSANLSRLRSPRVWGSDGSASVTSSLPYTPPPMLSPNRRGSGLFSSLTRWPSTASPVALTRRYSSHYMSSTCGTSSGDMLKRKSNHTHAVSFGSASAMETDGGQILKRPYTGRLMDPSSGEVGGISNSGLTTGDVPRENEDVDNLSGARIATHNNPPQFAFAKRRCQLTPKSAPVLLQEASAYTFQTFDQNTNSLEPAPQELPPVSSGTVFGYDDETMRRFAEADALDRARRVRRRRRRCDTDHLQSNANTLRIKLDTDPDLMQVDEKVGDLMNYKPQEELEIVEDTLAELDEEMQDQANYGDEELNDDDDDEEEGLPSSLIPRINIGDAFQAEIPEFNPESAIRSTMDSEKREFLLWYPGFIDDKDQKSIESLNLLMKLSCSPAIRHCGLNVEYAFHLLCKYEGNVEKALYALLRDNLVLDDYVYAETASWTTEEITRFQHGLIMYGRDFYLVARDLQASGMNKTVKACVEFYYVWKRMNTPSDVKWYREKARRHRSTARADTHMEDSSLNSFEVSDPAKAPVHPVITNGVDVGQLNATSTYNLRRKAPHTTTTMPEQPSVLPTVAEQAGDSQHLHFDDISTLETACTFDFTPCSSTNVNAESVGLDGVVSELVCSLTTDPLDEPTCFQCPFCQRVFTKVKSRNAHMKSHSDRAADPPESSFNRPLPQTKC